MHLYLVTIDCKICYYDFHRKRQVNIEEKRSIIQTSDNLTCISVLSKQHVNWSLNIPHPGRKLSGWLQLCFLYVWLVALFRGLLCLDFDPYRMIHKIYIAGKQVCFWHKPSKRNESSAITSHLPKKSSAPFCGRLCTINVSREGD